MALSAESETSGDDLAGLRYELLNGARPYAVNGSRVVSGVDAERGAMVEGSNLEPAMTTATDVASARPLSPPGVRGWLWLAPVSAASFLGLFFGVLIGMSTTPVVASVVSAMVGALATYGATLIGRKRVGPTSSARDPSGFIQTCAYLVGFAAFATLGLLGGVFERTHHLLSPTPQQVVNAWRDAGLLPEEAQQVALFLLAQMQIVPSDNSDQPSRDRPSPVPAPASRDFTDASGAIASSEQMRETIQRPIAERRKLAPAASPNAAIVYPAGLVSGEVDVCDEVVSALSLNKLPLAEHHAREAGGRWSKELQRLDTLNLLPEQRAQELLRFASTACTRPVR
jgi:hypothetical protein